jgi:hypothetical protein
MKFLGQHLLSRRAALGLLGAASLAASLPVRAQSLPAIVVTKDPGCGCCGAWVGHLALAGYDVKIIDTHDIQSVKERLGVPEDLAACHTAQVAGYVVEGHVPLAAIERLLSEKPVATGIAVAGMPAGSPGMEGGEPQVYDVVLFGPQLRVSFGRFRGDVQLHG